ncbi:DJ-1/PfpI family protein [Rhodanobacter sp. A1T4]|uniref:DJ-1/PfpI family protein n=1 Tax=Rhodanobacter sp. A1T4 TaxID=2723087 RepID=UPI00161A067F|nr:DJ-1/PfpI family protein [Rhodanobacter sp. A1T4]MBB6247455.1 putative intracellular protease/amidase [Rhodanobacter sp. A1T4]
MRDTVYFLTFEGFADWQAALALCEIRRPGDWQVQTAGFSVAAVVSMGGLTVQPDVSLAQIDLARAAMLIVPGGHLWLRGEGDEAVKLIRDVHAAGAPIAGIDSGVLALARAGLLDHCCHTGNWPGQIASQVKAYSGEGQYDASVLAVSDGGVITASHLGSVEFAHEIIHTLDLYNASDREHWYRLFKHAQLPPWYVGEAVAA